MKKLILIASLFLCSFTFSFGQTTTYKGQEYTIQTGIKGGKFIQVNDSTKVYVASTNQYSKPKDNGNGTATYKDSLYTIQTGSRGGKYILKGTTKIYIPKPVQN
jgi:glutamine cyclotransferase